MKRTTIVLALAAVLTLAFASIAEANYLSVKRARNAAFNVMRQECNHVQTCERFAAGPCTRLTPRKVRCTGHFFGHNARVGAYDCHRLVTVQIYPGSQDRFYNTGPRQCDEDTTQH